MGRLVIADFDRDRAVQPQPPAVLPRPGRRAQGRGPAGEPAGHQPLLRSYEVHDLRLNRRNAATVFARVDVLVEAFDKAEAKEMLIEACLAKFPGRPIVAASGLAGYGGNSQAPHPPAGQSLHLRRRVEPVPEGHQPHGPARGPGRGHAGQPRRRASGQDERDDMFKVNEYFDGKVKSLAFQDGRRAGHGRGHGPGRVRVRDVDGRDHDRRQRAS
ncbi:MAG: hypothetical protein MZV70_29550 [Desulfobacterales bacterium]|nr:hypothetical protein [Desulfobacterales bacterium]